MVMPNKYFLTFGGPTAHYHRAVNRICKQAYNSQMFDIVIGLTEAHLKMETLFWKTHVNFLESNKRGYGYWLWKPYIIMRQLEQMNDDDILIYADAGCAINTNDESRHRMSEYVDMVKDSEYGMLSFQMCYPENTYTKADILEHLNYKENTGQLVGTAFVLRKCKHAIDMVKLWYDTCCNYDLINDTPSKIPNAIGFIENRHDQSVWSVIRKQFGSIILEDETYFSNWHVDGHKYPIWAIRNTHS